ncbi:MAG: hypothetical protein ACR2LC_09680 [Pyrinomonadaceae bacterium]
MTLKLDHEIEGSARLDSALTLMVEGLADLSKLAPLVFPIYRESVERNFQSQGGDVRGWTLLTPADGRSRIRRGFGGSAPIEQQTGKLLASLTVEGAEGNVTRVSKDEIAYGSNLPYAKAQHYGNPARNLPERPLFAITDQDVRGFERVGHEHGVKIGREAGFETR